MAAKGKQKPAAKKPAAKPKKIVKPPAAKPKKAAKPAAKPAARKKPAESAPPGPALRAGDWYHVEIPVTDRERAKRFYGQVFGWTFQDASGMDYTLYCTHEGVAVGGGLFNPPPGVPRHWVNYVLVDRIEDAVAKIEQAGGRLINPKMEVQGTGWFALVADPDGNVFGLWQRMKV